MEYKCNLCSAKLSTIDSYCSHVNRHKATDDKQKSLQFNCPLCFKTSDYVKVSRLKTHLNNCLKESHQEIISGNSNENNKLLVEDITENITEDIVCDLEYDSDVEMEEFIKTATSYSSDRATFDNTLQYCLEWFAKKNLSLKMAEEIINSTKSLVEKYLSDIGNKMKRCISVEDTLQCFEKLSFEVTKSLDLLNTIQKVKTTARNRGLFSEPKQFVVRNETVQILGEIEEQQSMGTIMPIKHEVKGFLEMPGVFEAIIENQKKMKESPLPNLVNGKIGKDILRRNEGKAIVFIGIYQDDFNPDNPLGPHTSTTKLSSYYYNYPTLPEHLAVNLKNIFLAAVHKSKDVNNEEVLSHGIDPAIFAIWDAFNPLEKEGLEVEINGIKQIVYLAVSQFYGDNLGLNTCFGFARGFTAAYCCRVCEIQKDLMETSLDINEDLLRQGENFAECLEGITSDSRKGVKYDSWLNMFQFFKVYTNYSVDIMHDVFLGVFRYDLIAVLKYYIDKSVFSLKQFNQAKRIFDYGTKDKGNISVDITEAHLRENVKINAKEMWTLVEYLPLILSTLLTAPNQCRVFQFVLKMVDVLDNITRKRYTNEEILEMKDSIKQHHKMYLQLFNKKLTIKFHLMLHYDHIIRLIGPLRHSMTFKFEAKHQECKEYAHCCQSRRNLPFSICNKFCFNFALRKLLNEKLTNYITEIKPQSFKNLSWSPTNRNFETVTSLRYKGIYFNIGDIIQTNSCFYTIRGLAHCKENVLFYVEILKCRYSPSLLSFEIIDQTTGSFGEILIDDIISNPVDCHAVANKFFFRIKH